jgi:hypothetical protein
MLSHVRIFGNPEVSTQFPECSVMPVTSGSIRELAAMRSGKAQLLKIPFELSRWRGGCCICGEERLASAA